MFSKNKSEVYSFFMGVILCEELKNVITLKPEKIIIGGKKQIKTAVSIILKNKIKADITVLSDEKINSCVALGAVKIYELSYIFVKGIFTYKKGICPFTKAEIHGIIILMIFN